MTTWINYEGIMLSEISQTEKDKCYMILLMCGIKKQKAKLINIRGQVCGYQRWRVVIK